jgi:hypothetical protein
LIRIYLYTFENGLSDIKILVENIKSTILKKQKKIGKAEKTSKSRIFLLKSEEVAALADTPRALLGPRTLYYGGTLGSSSAIL